MQNIIQIPQNMKTGVPNVFKWEISTLPFYQNYIPTIFFYLCQLRMYEILTGSVINCIRNLNKGLFFVYRSGKFFFNVVPQFKTQPWNKTIS